MKHIQKYNNFILEDVDTDMISKYQDLKEEIKEMIKKSLNSEDDSVISEFITSFIKAPEDNKIEGLINDSDIYEFYLKWRNDIDDILGDINFFDEVPSEIKVYSLYDYIIQGTNKAVEEVISMME
jgi:hypothetical protein